MKKTTFLVIIFVICFNNLAYAKKTIYPKNLDLVDDVEKVVQDIYSLIENGISQNSYIVDESYSNIDDIKAIVNNNIILQHIGDAIISELEGASKLNVKAKLVELNKYYYSKSKQEVLAVGLFKVSSSENYSTTIGFSKHSFNFNKLFYNIKLDTNLNKDLYLPFLFIASTDDLSNPKTEGLLVDDDSTLFKTVDEYHNSNFYKLITGQGSSNNLSQVVDNDANNLSSWAINSKYYIDRYVPIDMLNNYRANITRKEFAKLAVCSYIKIQEEQITKLSDQKPDDFDLQLIQKFEETYTKTGRKYEQNVFTDTNDYFVNLAYAFGIVNGFSGSYYPDNNISREEAAVLVSNIVKLLDIYPNSNKKVFADVEPSSFALESIENLSSITTIDGNAIMQGISEDMFEPKGLYTKEQAYITIAKLVRAFYKN